MPSLVGSEMCIRDSQHPLKCSDNETTESYINKLSSIIWEFPSNMNEKAMDFFKKACSIEYVNRFSAQQALQHTWITGEGKLSDPITLNDMFKLYDTKQSVVQIIKLLYLTQFMKTKCEQKVILVKNEQILNQFRKNADNQEMASTQNYIQNYEIGADNFRLNINNVFQNQFTNQITQIPSSRSVCLQNSQQRLNVSPNISNSPERMNRQFIVNINQTNVGRQQPYQQSKRKTSQQIYNQTKLYGNNCNSSNVPHFAEGKSIQYKIRKQPPKNYGIQTPIPTHEVSDKKKSKPQSSYKSKKIC
eukprot:TRINITY_DN15100_c0_g1_i3.p1 TRINITY_DN15100_c0_g1~~TRINITY_DN15100_c0_g1_i3.p1  ORF type:complete len:303 (-),score=41.46 TRINITY_DN15100_c0_g1_i3:572-1480(-)